jgi:undecaprenyl diphosphate synthase
MSNRLRAMSKNGPPIPPERIPQHIAIIMDGNGRWAKQRGLPRLAGHKAGTENLRRIIRASVEFGIRYLTIYAFSTENWNRPREEVDGLMRIVEDVIEKELRELDEQGVQLRHLGKLDQLSPNLQKKVLKAVEQTRHNTRLVLNVAFNYGGRDEIIHAIRQMLVDKLNPDDVTPEIVSKYLYTAESPDPDLIIRTSGELRVSNFLIWQGAYSEWYVTPTYWPDFGKDELGKALEAYASRDRRYGKVDASEYENTHV